ncbi:hypothetical protein GH741_18950 [Aquibacillus halophilus]|uniref:Uncharacterized protein n=1 Tax=Aquibacillus halophilus TaxID=930132 RepID=A0A6A8DHM2_9BACI|nr:hypothetical protein [Aquibacillus halophilus]MRH44730.1 hypothetical protein [Aquibacillus halophilus]
MSTVKKSDLEKYINSPVQVCIHGKEGEDRAPWIDRQISQLALCPDQTHLRIYFDKHFFFAVPLESKVDQNEQQWSAYDKNAELYYVIRSEEKIE